jgi:hypothetical protein
MGMSNLGGVAAPERLLVVRRPSASHHANLAIILLGIVGLSGLSTLAGCGGDGSPHMGDDFGPLDLGMLDADIDAHIDLGPCGDGATPATWYADTDLDGLGDPADATVACEAPLGYVANADDTEPACMSNDTDRCGLCAGDGSSCDDCAGVLAGSAYVDDCGVCSEGTSGHVANSDQDACGVCNGPGQVRFYEDVDGDGQGDPAVFAVACVAPAGYVGNADDTQPACATNDTDACGVCAGPGEPTWYRDQDGDGLGDPSMSMTRCTVPGGYVGNADDTDPLCMTNNTDACGVCAGSGPRTWYADADADGLGDPASSMASCTMPSGYVMNASDLDPTCTSNDRDVCGVCGGDGAVTWYRDQDSDGLGDATMSMSSCTMPSGYVGNDTDTEPNCTTNNTDICGVCGGSGSGCQDCAGVVDGAARVDSCGVCSGGSSGHTADSDRDACGICFGPGEPVWYADMDGDGQGDPAVAMSACSRPTGYVANATDTEPSCATNNTDSCGVCDGPGQTTYYDDTDGDGLGDPAMSMLACTMPSGYVSNGSDAEPSCVTNDTDSCGVCGGPGQLYYYDDTDGDGLGDPAVSMLACTMPSGYVANLNDTDPGCGSTRDSCGVCGGSGPSVWYADLDGDGLGDPATTMMQCSMPANYVDNDDDTAPSCTSNVVDVCGVCDGPGQTRYYDDTDGDGLGDPAMSMLACTMPSGYVVNANDTDPTCGGVRDACGVCGGPGTIVWYDDTDTDGLGDPLISVAQCAQPSGHVANANDTDVDNDGVLDDGDGSGTRGDAPCAHLQTTGCDDNCRVNANGGQSDADHDLVGDACDTCTDGDGDGWFRAGTDGAACPFPTQEDCDDSNPDAQRWWTAAEDTDGDGYAYSSPSSVCLAAELPDGYSTVGGDCDRHDPRHWSDCGTCTTDNDDDGRGGPTCDLGPDCDDTDANHWSDCDVCFDTDFDGYGPGCDLGTDCLEDDPIANPGSGEIPDDGLDNDCAGDGDGTRSDAAGIFVTDSCGLHPGNDSNPGTMAQPVATLARAIELAEAADKVVYADNDLFGESGLETTVSMFGAYDCDAGWTRNLTSRSLQMPLGNGNGLSVDSSGRSPLGLPVMVDRFVVNGYGGGTALSAGGDGRVAISNVEAYTVRTTLGVAVAISPGFHSDGPGTVVLDRIHAEMSGETADAPVLYSQGRARALVSRAEVVDNTAQDGGRSMGVLILGPYPAGLPNVGTTIVRSTIDGVSHGVVIGVQQRPGARARLIDNTISAGASAGSLPPYNGDSAAVSVEWESTAYAEGNTITGCQRSDCQGSTAGIQVRGDSTLEAFENVIRGGAGRTQARGVDVGFPSSDSCTVTLVGNRIYAAQGLSGGLAVDYSYPLHADGPSSYILAVNNLFHAGEGQYATAVWVEEATLDLVGNTLIAGAFTLPGSRTESLRAGDDATVVAVNNAMATGAGTTSRAVVSSHSSVDMTLVNNSFVVQDSSGDWCRVRVGATCEQSLANVDACGWGGCAEATNNFAGSPLYIGGNYRIDATSALYNAGVDPSPWYSDPYGYCAVDWEGDPRPSDGGWDVGRDEYVP